MGREMRGKETGSRCGGVDVVKTCFNVQEERVDF